MVVVVVVIVVVVAVVVPAVDVLVAGIAVEMLFLLSML